MKILKRIILGVIIFVAITYVLPASLLQVPYFQEKISSQVASYLTNKLHSKVQIHQIELGFFNKLILRGMYMEDLSGEVLFQAKRVAAGFELTPLFQKKFRFNSIQLFTFQFNLSRETDDSPLNIQYIIDAFAKQDTTTTNPAIDLKIKKLNLQMGSFSYRVKDKAETPAGIFNPKNILLHNISSKIQVNDLTNQKLDLLFDKLSFKEQSGFQVKNIIFDLNANKHTAKINQLMIELDKSSLLLTDISANYNLQNTSKNEEDSVAFQLKLMPSAIYPKELSAFVPALSHFDDKVSVEGDLTGNERDIKIKNLHLQYFDQIMITADADLRNIFHPDKNLFYIRGNIPNSYFSPEGIERMVNNFSSQPVELPAQIKQMKNMRFEGNINGSFDDLAAWGVLNTDIGTIRTNLTLGKNETQYIKGEIASESLNLGTLLNNKDFGETIFDIRLDAKQNPDKKFSGSVDANLTKFVYKGYTYQNLTLNGNFTPTSFEGKLNLDSPEGKISGDGLWAFNGKDSKFDFNAKLSDLQLDKLNLTKKYKNPLLSAEVNANLTGDNIDNFTGDVSLKDVRFATDSNHYSLKNFQVAFTPLAQGKRIHINSEILKGDIWGDFSFKTLVPALKQTFANYLPSLIKPDPKYSGNSDTNLSLQLRLADLTGFSKTFELPFSLQGETNIFGLYKSNENALRLEFNSPHAILGGSKIDSLRLACTNSDTLKVGVSGIHLQKKNRQMQFDVQLKAIDDKLNTLLRWGNGSDKYRGNLDLTTSFSKPDNNSPTHIETNIKQTGLVFNDSIWTLYPATVVIDSSNIRINHVQAFHNDQFLKIQGAISHNPEEKLQIDLNKVDLEYIFQSLNIPALEFGGSATGYVTAQDLFTTRKMETHLDVTDFAFNSTNFGHLDLTGTWDDAKQGILMLGKVIKNDSTYVDVDGIIYPVKEELSIDFNAKNADARFLRKYLNTVVQNLTGNLSGHLRLFGDLNNPTVEGNVFARNCRFGIAYLNTYYSFTDSVRCLPDTIKINNITLYDEAGNKAIASGYVKHRLFQNFYFTSTVSYSNLMIFNANKALNPMFYGTAFGTGTASIYGTENVINIDVTAQNTERTKMTLDFMEEPDIVDYDFIRFTSVKKPSAESLKKPAAVSTPSSYSSGSGPEIKFNLLLGVTPQATIDIIMDPVSGDKISGYGKGNLQIQYGTKIPLRVFGNYVIERGKYNFSLQQLFIRNFDIQENSTVAFRGDPYTADLNIKANYRVNANLEDLNPSLIERSTRNNVPVDCILQLTGPMNRPAVAFDLDLPGATDELARQVKSYIRTDDMMSRQIVYLLVLSRFYTPPENIRDNSTNANTNLSYLTSTLSTQISNMLGLLSDNFRLGTIFHQTNTGAQTSTEFELLLSSQLLNNRLIVNGNFGYSNNPMYTPNQNKLPLIGDFDLEYKLTKAGDIRLTGFNHYNYRYFYSLTPEMTQGIGILFRKDFNHWLDLFGRKNNE